MKGKSGGILRIVISLIIVAGMLFIAIAGIGSNKSGSLSNVKLGLDLAGGVSITYQIVDADATSEEIADTRSKMQRRAESFSTEAEVYMEGDDRITVDIPDVTDADAVLKKLGDAGTIYFIYGMGPDGIQNIVTTVNSQTGEYESQLLIPMEQIIANGDVVIDGSDIASAEAGAYNKTLGVEYVVELKLNEKGTEKFADATSYAAPYRNSSDSYRNVIAIVYDGEVVSAPGVTEAITGGVASISGQKDIAEARELATIIRIGALPLELSVLRYNVVGAKLGEEAIDTSLLAGIIGFIIIVAFMIVFYRVPGLAADIALLLYVALLVIALNIFNVTLTLPGVAGILLSIGMAVDANVIIFTRIKEEIGLGKTVRSSIKSGFNKAMSAIVDGNITTIIAAVVLYFLGSGTVKGFATTLAIGVVLSMLTALFVTKFILTGFFEMGLNKVNLYGLKKEVTEPKSFVKRLPRFIMVSLTVLVIGIVFLIINKVSTGNSFSYGLDFSGGTSTQITFPGEMPSNSEIEALVADKCGTTAEIAKVEGENSLIVKTKVLETEERAALTASLIEKYGVDEALIETTTISSTVSGEMKRDAVVATIIATLCMLVYIFFRFKNIGFALAAVIALIHDVLLVLMVYAIFANWLSVGNTFIACMLTIVGYSINATIVIFDRIRENMAEKLKKQTVADVVNLSITQTLSRSINTSVTTFIMVFMIAILGVASVKEFAFPFIAGIIFGTFSSVCLTGSIWYKLRKAGEEE